MGLKSQALLGGSYRIFLFVTFLFVLIVLFLFVLLFKTIQKHVQKGLGGFRKRGFEVPGALKNRSWGGLESFWGCLRRAWSPGWAPRGTQITFLMTLRCFCGHILGAFGIYFFYFFNVVLQVALDMCFSFLLGGFGHQKLKMSCWKNVDFP